MKCGIRKFAAVLIVIFAAAVLTAQTKKAGGTFTNPLITSQDSADPWMFYHKGFYYLTATLDPEGGVWLRRSKTLAGFDAGEKKKIYDAPQNGTAEQTNLGAGDTSHRQTLVSVFHCVGRHGRKSPDIRF